MEAQSAAQLLFLECYADAMRRTVTPFRVLLISVAGRLGQQQRDAINYLREEDRVPASRIASSACVALLFGRNPKLHGWKSASKIGSITNFAAIWITRSLTVGPKGV